LLLTRPTLSELPRVMPLFVPYTVPIASACYTTTTEHVHATPSPCISSAEAYRLFINALPRILVSVCHAASNGCRVFSLNTPDLFPGEDVNKVWCTLTYSRISDVIRDKLCLYATLDTEKNTLNIDLDQRVGTGFVIPYNTSDLRKFADEITNQLIDQCPFSPHPPVNIYTVKFTKFKDLLDSDCHHVLSDKRTAFALEKHALEFARRQMIQRILKRIDHVSKNESRNWECIRNFPIFQSSVSWVSTEWCISNKTADSTWRLHELFRCVMKGVFIDEVETFSIDIEKLNRSTADPELYEDSDDEDELEQEQQKQEDDMEVLVL